MHIHPKKFNRIAREQTKDAMTVYESTPLQQAWTVEKICTQIHRDNDLPMAKTKVNGCLRHLQQVGLIREVGINHFQRIPVSMKKPKEQPTITFAGKQEKEMPKQDLLEKFANVSKVLRNIADTIDELALEVESEVEAAGNKTGKLAELQKILKSIQED